MTERWEEIRQRIRGLVRVPEGDWTSDLLNRVEVDERALAGLGGDEAQQRLVRLIIVLARVYGLDPTWVLTGKYDPATHRVALESNTDEIAIMTTQLIKRARSPQDPPARTLG